FDDSPLSLSGGFSMANPVLTDDSPLEWCCRPVVTFSFEQSGGCPPRADKKK
ncbi:hypothetical protein A2U01_0075255, partial [Trifolium medium]|nr:hypothetical protein [Trifolium medium]